MEQIQCTGIVVKVDVPGSASQDIKICQSKTGKKCRKFAFKRTVKWKNGINPAKGKASHLIANGLIKKC